MKNKVCCILPLMKIAFCWRKLSYRYGRGWKRYCTADLDDLLVGIMLGSTGPEANFMYHCGLAANVT